MASAKSSDSPPITEQSNKMVNNQKKCLVPCKTNGHKQHRAIISCYKWHSYWNDEYLYTKYIFCNSLLNSPSRVRSLSIRLKNLSSSSHVRFEEQLDNFTWGMFSTWASTCWSLIYSCVKATRVTQASEKQQFVVEFCHEYRAVSLGQEVEPSPHL